MFRFLAGCITGAALAAAMFAWSPTAERPDDGAITYREGVGFTRNGQPWPHLINDNAAGTYE